jgi:hypothetical protein
MTANASRAKRQRQYGHINESKEALARRLAS